MLLQEAIDAASRKGRPFKNPENEAKAMAKRASTLADLQRKAQQAKKFATAARQAAAAAAGWTPDTWLLQHAPSLDLCYE